MQWKGLASYWTLLGGDRRLPGMAWSYPEPMAGAEPLADCVAFHATVLGCRVDGARVEPQAGGFMADGSRPN